MKVELQCGDTITIPEGCKAIVKDGSVVFEKEEKEQVQEFKDGDIVILCGRTIKDRHPFIFKREDDMGRQKFYVGIDFNNILRTFHDDEYYNARQLHRPTEEEKQFLFNKMKEKGLRWNAKEKRLEKINWRAEKDKKYFVSGCSGNLGICIENDCIIDDHLYEFGNYFRTKEQAKKAAEAIKETLRKLHEEMGE